MKIIKFILIMIGFIPQITHAIYRVYTGSLGNRKVEFYVHAIKDSSFDIRYIDKNTGTIKYLGLPEKKGNDYYFNVEEDDFIENTDSIMLRNFDFSENMHHSPTDFLAGYSNYYGNFILEKQFEYNTIWNNGDERNQIDSEQLLNNTKFENVEFLQMNSTKDFYFKVLLSKKEKEDIKITGINIYSKKNGKLFQTISNSKGYLFHTFFAIQIGDFDFDGNKNDFSLSNGETHGTNVPHIYYIYDKSQHKFIEANLEGYVFDFDIEKRIATGTKTCGDVFLDSIYITLNKMYYFNDSKKKYNYVDQYCIAYDNFNLRQCTINEKQDCEVAIVEAGDEP